METTGVSCRIIHFCEKCNRRIPEAEMGDARRLPDGQAVCGGCAASLAVAAPSSQRAASERVSPERASRSAIPAAQPSRPTARARGVPAATGRGFPLPIVAGLGVLALTGIAIGVMWLGSSEAPAGRTSARKSGTVGPPAPTHGPGEAATTRRPDGADVSTGVASPSSVPTGASGTANSSPRGTDAGEKPDTYDPRRETSNLLLGEARRFRAANPKDLFGYREKLEYLCTNFGGTPAAEEARALMESEARLPELPDERNPRPPAPEAWANAVQILPTVDTGKDRVSGWWKMENGRLRSDKAMWAMIGFPYVPPEEYDVRVVFERIENDDCLLVILSRRGRPFIFSIGSGNRHCSLETVRESRADILPTKTVRPNIFPNRQRVEIVVQVRRLCLRAYLNGKAIVGCQVDDDGLSLNPSLKLPKDGQVGLATWNSVYEFQSFEILPVTGSGTLLR